MAIKISRVLHAGYVFKTSKVQILFDPLFESPFSQNCFAYPPVEFDYDEIRKQKFDAVIISHFHDDHLSLESLQYIDRKTPIYLFSVFPEFFSFLRQMGFENVSSIRLNEKMTFQDISITALKALDEDVDSIFHIQSGELQILNVVDSWIHPDTEDVIKKISWDLILWPFQTMRELEVLSPNRLTHLKPEIPTELLEQLAYLKPKFLIPSSCQFRHEDWSWYKHYYFPISYSFFAEEAKKILPRTHIIRLDPSKTIMLDQTGVALTENLSWLKSQTGEELDYKFDPSAPIPPTSQLTQHFPPLNSDQIHVLEKFAHFGLIKTYHNLHHDTESYFDRKRIWELKIHFSDHDSLTYFYEIEKGSMKYLKTFAEADWRTEIPAFKLWQALENGESLSSLYIRINDGPFSPQIERNLQAVDIMEDPLIRSLYTSKIGEYQRQQLRRLLASISATETR